MRNYLKNFTSYLTVLAATISHLYVGYKFFAENFHFIYKFFPEMKFSFPCYLCGNVSSCFNYSLRDKIQANSLICYLRDIRSFFQLKIPCSMRVLMACLIAYLVPFFYVRFFGSAGDRPLSPSTFALVQKKGTASGYEVA